MGEAKRRKEARWTAFAEGRVFSPTPQCPACHSLSVRRLAVDDPANEKLRQWVGCDLEVCLESNCRAAWEAFPATGYVEDPVCAEPCDNCAFKPGSNEQQDRAKWRALLDTLKPVNGHFGGRFYCHKGVPIDIRKGPGNFKFPTKQDGSWDQSKMRLCSGFLRMFWALTAKEHNSKWPA